MPTFKEIEVEVSKLINDFENARHPVQSSEREVIDWMLKELGKEIFNLAEDIAIHDLSPIDKVLVMPKTKSTFVVMEGNRRVLAAKLLNNPSLADGTKWATKFEALRRNYRNKIPKSISVVCTTDKAEALRLIKIRHHGKDQGRGVLSWNPQQAARAQRRQNGQSARYEESLQIIDYAIEHNLLGSESETLKDRKFPITTLERLLKDPAVCNALGISHKPTGWEFEIRPEESHKGISRVLRDLLKKDKTVSDVKNKQLRETYISSLGDDLPSQKATLESPLPLDSVPKDIKKLTKKAIRIKDPSKRAKLIDEPINVADKKILRTFIELREIDIVNFPKATMALIRVFFEQSVDAYLTKHNLPLKKSSGDRLELRQRFKSALEHLCRTSSFEKALGTKLTGIANANAGQAGAADIDNLHLHLHSTYHFGSSSEVVDIWDSTYGPFLKELWSKM
jgi:hypothetical protein